MKYGIILLLLTLTFFAQAQEDIITMTTPSGAKVAFEKFIKKEKFGQDNLLKYEGMKDPILRSSLTKKVNQIGKEFMEVSSEEVPSDFKYQKKIMFGLSSFNDIKDKLKKEDRARVCHYIIELMDIIDLKSSKGQLNMFTYGFDPSTLKIDKPATQE
jgi:hypothetical protein